MSLAERRRAAERAQMEALDAIAFPTAESAAGLADPMSQWDDTHHSKSGPVLPAACVFGIEEAAADLVTTEGAAALLGISLAPHETEKLCAFGAWLDGKVARRLCWFAGDLARSAQGFAISPSYHYPRASVEALLLGDQFAA